MCNTIICKITHDTGGESAVAQMVRFGLGTKFKPRSEFSLLFFSFFLSFFLFCSFLWLSFFLVVTFLLGLVFRVTFAVWFVGSLSNDSTLILPNLIMLQVFKIVAIYGQPVCYHSIHLI